MIYLFRVIFVTRKGEQRKRINGKGKKGERKRESGKDIKRGKEGKR